MHQLRSKIESPLPPRRVAIFGWASSILVATRAKAAHRRKRLYLRKEKLLALLSLSGRKKILFAGMPKWSDAIKGGFRRLPHLVDFGPITEDSFERYDIVVPLDLSDIEDAQRLCKLQKSAYPLPTAQSVRLCHDKYEFNQTLIKAGFGRYVPKMVQGTALSPPYILKKSRSQWGDGCYIIRNPLRPENSLERITDPQYFCQELIPGNTEFATHILIVNGKIIKALNIKYKFASDTPIKGKDVDSRELDRRCPYLDLFAQVLRTVQFEGLCCVNYKVINGQPFLLEINPRCGGSLAPYFFSFIRHLR